MSWYSFRRRIINTGAIRPLDQKPRDWWLWRIQALDVWLMALSGLVGGEGEIQETHELIQTLSHWGQKGMVSDANHNGIVLVRG